MVIPSRSRFQGYLVGRSAVLVSLLVLAAAFQAQQGGFPGPFRWFFAVTGLSFVVTLLSAPGVWNDESRGAWTRLQPLWDVAYATALVYLSGGAFSFFASLYPLAIIGGAILLYRRGALLVATASSLAYGLLVDLQYYGVIAPLNPFPFPEASDGNPALQLLFALVAFYAVAFLSGYLAEELKRTGERLVEVEAEVLDLEHLKESILHSLGSGLVALDRNGREVFHNRAAEELLSQAGMELQPRANLSEAFDLTEGDRREVRLEGSQIVLGYGVSPLFDRDGQPRGSILIFQDVTKVKLLEEDLRRSDRLAAVGRLAAGLAHEIRNPLASLSGSVEVLRGSVETCPQDGPLFEIVLRETDRLNRLVTNFLHYARPGRVESSEVALRELADEVGFFFGQGEGKERLRLLNRIPEGLRLAGDRAQMEQLLLNLFRNSVEAASGEVTVTLDAALNDDTVCVTVRDDGPGMNTETAERVFEPFYTRKEGGTGLGLATVHRIVQNHGGSVTLETAEGRGAAFHFRFPAGAKAASRSDHAQQTEPGPRVRRRPVPSAPPEDETRAPTEGVPERVVRDPGAELLRVDLTQPILGR